MADIDVDERTDLLAAAIEARLPPSSEWSFPGGYPHSLALAVIEAIQSMGVHYGSVVKVIGRYRGYRQEQGGDAHTDGITELKATFDELGVHEWSAVIGNGHRTSTAPGPITKAEAIRRAARALAAQGITTAGDLRTAGAEELEDVRSAWLAVPGQKSGISWLYLLMLAGVPGVKPDRMIRRFVEGAVGESHPALTDGEVAALVERAAERFGVSASDLDHAIWRSQSGREARKPMDRTLLADTER